MSLDKFLRGVVGDSRVIKRSSAEKRAAKRQTRFASYRQREHNFRRELELARLRAERREAELTQLIEKKSRTLD